jgi:hypothetical protein
MALGSYGLFGFVAAYFILGIITAFLIKAYDC